MDILNTHRFRTKNILYCVDSSGDFQLGSPTGFSKHHGNQRAASQTNAETHAKICSSIRRTGFFSDGLVLCYLSAAECLAGNSYLVRVAFPSCHWRIMRSNKWMLPEGIDELVPPQAEDFIILQQKILSIFFSYGYELFDSSLVEFADSLVIAKAEELEQEIVKFVDQSSGGQLGLRADFTPQAARIEANRLSHNKPNRICYCGHVFRNLKNYDQFRNPVQAGVELFGDSSLRGDKEVMLLLVDCLTSLTNKKLVIDIGHAQLWQSLVNLAGLSSHEKKEYFAMMTAKQVDLIEEFVNTLVAPQPIKDFLTQLPRLYGDQQTLKEAKKLAKPIGDKKLASILANVQSVVNELRQDTDAEIFIDLGEMPGGSYSYHNGLVFGAYFYDKSHCFARGGRYDSIAENYGKARAATGFSIDVRSLFYYLTKGKKSPQMIFAPYRPSDDLLKKEIQQLRRQGRRVVSALNARQTAATLGCAYELLKRGNSWVVKETDG